MRIKELESGIAIYLTNEENALLKKIKEPTPRKSLDEREQVIANQLVIKEMLTRKKVDGKTVYERVKTQ